MSQQQMVFEDNDVHMAILARWEATTFHQLADVSVKEHKQISYRQKKSFIDHRGLDSPSKGNQFISPNYFLKETMVDVSVTKKQFFTIL